MFVLATLCEVLENNLKRGHNRSLEGKILISTSDFVKKKKIQWFQLKSSFNKRQFNRNRPSETSTAYIYLIFHHRKTENVRA